MRLLLFPPVLMVVVFLPAAIAYRYLDPAGRPPFTIYALRWFLGILFTISGLAKLIPGFPNTMGPPDLVATLASHGLAPFGRFIAVSEVGIGLLLLTRRFATIGALALVPMLTSIFIITSALHWRGTPFVVAGFLALNLVVLLHDYPRLLPLLGGRPPAPVDSFSRADTSPLPWLAGTGVVLLSLGFFRFESRTEPMVFLVIIALAGLVILDWRRSPTG